MKLADKIKTFAIGVTTALLTSCGIKKNEAQIVERHPANHAFNIGSDTKKGAKRNHAGEHIWVTDIDHEQDSIQRNRNAYQEDSIDTQMRQKWQEELDAAGIPIAKKGENDTDSLLVSVEEKDGKLQNPVYGLNPKVSQNKVEKIGEYTIERAEKKYRVNKFDGSSFGAEDAKTVYDRISTERKLVDNEKVEKELRKGDKVFGHVVEEDGKSPVVVSDVYKAKRLYTFNYKRNEEGVKE